MQEKHISSPVKIIAAFTVITWGCFALFSLGLTQGYSLGKRQIPYKVRVKYSDFVTNGWIVWLKEGQNGYKNEVSGNIRMAGRVIKKKVVYNTPVLKKPVEAFVVKGLSKRSNPITVPKNTYAHYTYDMEATAYDPSPESNGLDNAGITALGWRTRYGIAAVDPRIIALRSLIYVEGYGFAWAGDTGGDIKGRRVDLCYNTTREALKWGRRKVRVYVLGSKPWNSGGETKKSD